MFLATLDRDVRESYEVVDLGASTLARAVDLVRIHALRGADSIQLACALLSRGGDASENLIFVGSDRELNKAASAEGFPIIDPMAH